MKRKEFYKPKDRAAVQFMGSRLSPFIKQVVPLLPSEPASRMRAWQQLVGKRCWYPYEWAIPPILKEPCVYWYPYEWAIPPILEEPCVKAAVLQGDISMAAQLSLCMDPTLHECMYLADYDKHERVLIVAASLPSDEIDGHQLIVTTFSNNPHQVPTYQSSKTAAEKTFGFLMFKAVENELIPADLMRRLASLKNTRGEPNA
jgi:hypothetical protein